MSNPSIDIERQMVFLNTEGVKKALARNGYTGSHITWTSYCHEQDGKGRLMFDAECRVKSALQREYQLIYVSWDEQKGIVAEYDTGAILENLA